jgi:WD40 repeat protein
MHRKMIRLCLLLVVFMLSTTISAQQLLTLYDISDTTPAWSPDGSHIAYLNELEVQIRSAASNTVIASLREHTGRILAVSWSPDGQVIATGGEDRILRMWESETGNLIATFDGHTDMITDIVWSRDGSRLISGQSPSEGSDSLYVRDAKTGEIISTSNGGSVAQIAFSPDESLLAIVHNFRMGIIYDGVTFERIRYFGDMESEPTNQMDSVTWSPNGSLILTGGFNGGVHLWNAADGELMYRFPGSLQYNPEASFADLPIQTLPFTWVRSVTFTPDGSQILSASGDGTVQIWDIATQTVVSHVQLAPIGAAAWSPDGTMLAYLPPKLVEQAPDGSLRVAPVDDFQLRIIAPFALPG